MNQTENQLGLLTPFLKSMAEYFVIAHDQAAEVHDDVTLIHYLGNITETAQALLTVMNGHGTIAAQRIASDAVHNAAEQARPLSDEARKALLNSGTALAGVLRQ